MSENSINDLESLLDQATQGPNLADSLSKLSKNDFDVVVSQVGQEFQKRTPVDPSNLTDAQFRQLLSNYGL